MKNIEELLKFASYQDVSIPSCIEDKIIYTLKIKKKKKILLLVIQKILAFITALMGIFIGGMAVYAGVGGKIEGIPATDWLGIKFSNSYLDYKKEVKNQVITYKDTTVELTSTVCNEGITILEFDIKLSEDDYLKLRLDEKIYSDEFYKLCQENKKEQEKIYRKLANEEGFYAKYYGAKFEDGAIVEMSNYSPFKSDEEFEEIHNNFEISEDEYKNTKYYNEYINWCEELDETIEEWKNTGYTIALALNVEQKGGTYHYDKFNPNIEWYANIYIDDKPYYVKAFEKIEKITDYEYKIYVMYMLTDDELDGKEEFKITLKNNKLVNMVNWKSRIGDWNNNPSEFASESFIQEYTNLDIIDLDGEYIVDVSKKEILNDSIIIDNTELKSEFRNITHNVDKIVVSPIQTIVKITKTATNQSSNNYNVKDSNIEYFPLTKEYKVYDSSGKELKCFNTSNKNTLIYSDGTREDYDTHDIPNKNYKNAIWENIIYLFIENTNSDYIKIVPKEAIHNSLDGLRIGKEEFDYDMEPIIINLKNDNTQ